MRHYLANISTKIEASFLAANCESGGDCVIPQRIVHLLNGEENTCMASRKDIAEQRRRLETYRANLQTLLDQKANVGGEPTATLPLVNLIGETRKEIKRIKKILRDWGEKIDDHPDDFQEFDDEPDAIDFLRRLIGWLRRNGLLVVIGLAIFGIAAFLISPVFSRPSQATAPTLTAMPLSPTVANPTITPAKQPTATLADPQTAEPTAVPSPTDTPSLEPTSTSTLTPTATSTATPTFTPKVPTHTTTRTPRPPTITPTTTPIPPPAACFRGTPEDLIKAEAEAALTKNQWIIHQIFKRDAAIEDRTRKIHRNDAWEYYREKYDDTTYSTAEHPTIQLVRAIGPEDTTAAYKSTSKGEFVSKSSGPGRYNNDDIENADRWAFEKQSGCWVVSKFSFK